MFRECIYAEIIANTKASSRNVLGVFKEQQRSQGGCGGRGIGSVVEDMSESA